MDAYFQIIGWICAVLGSLVLVGLLAIAALEFFVRQSWRRLTALYNMETLRWGFSMLKAHGRQFPQVSIEEEKQAQGNT